MILAINCGSSSVKFAAYRGAEEVLVRGKIQHVSGAEVAQQIVGRLDKIGLLDSIKAVGHRIVHGGNRRTPVLIYDTVMAELEESRGMAPIHMTAALDMVQSLRRALPEAHHVACFDTMFHADLPDLARTMPLPRYLTDKGIARYGFHGLSCTYLLRTFARRAGERAASGKLIIAHLGSGASMTAVKGMKSIDTTMGFTPEAGLMMGTRPGDIDPGVFNYLMRTQGFDLTQLERMMQSECGLVGVSGVSSDMGELLEMAGKDARARQAVDLFCYQAQKFLCGLCGPLGGVDAVIFSGGIGENFPEIRAQICKGLGFLGISLDETSNTENAFEISRPSSSTRVYVIKTDEEAIIAEQTLAVVENLN